MDNYRAFAEQRAAQLGTTVEALLTGDGGAGTRITHCFRTTSMWYII